MEPDANVALPTVNGVELVLVLVPTLKLPPLTTLNAPVALPEPKRTPLLLTVTAPALPLRMTVPLLMVRNGSVLPDESGLGKSSITVKVPYIKEAVEKFEVEATAPEYNLNATETHFVMPENPQIVFYENNPLLGITLNRALNETFDLNKDEIEVIAYPFTFDSSIINETSAKFRWSINGNRVSPTAGKNNIITLRRPVGTKGLSSISLSIENTKRVFESSSKSLKINLSDPNTKSVQF